MALPATYHGSDFYCDVALPHLDDLDVVAMTELVVAYNHTRPHWPVHVVAFPKRHIASFSSIAGSDEPDMRELFAVVQRVATDMETRHGAARVLTNLGSYQDSKHLHVHIASGRALR